MNQYKFLRDYVSQLSDEEKSSYRLRSGAAHSSLNEQTETAPFKLPEELLAFYSFSNGAKLDDYEILTIPQIVNALEELRETYGEAWNESIIPFARVSGVGDWIAFNTADISKDGLAILDGFHEVPPVEWEKICTGLISWLKQMCNNNFRPFWLA